jgi:DNA repair protein RadC
LLRDGTGSLSDGELLAVILRMGCRGQSAVDLGQALLARFGSMHGLLSASPKEIRAVHGIGLAKSAQLQAILELARRTLTERLRDNTALDSPEVVRNYLRLFIGVRSYEVFVCLYLDSKHRLIRTVEASRGTLTHTAVYPREIAREALALNAAGLIVAHNHPSGDARPSAADRHLTQRLSETLQLIEVKLLDHLIVGENVVFSFAERGLL